MRGILFVPVYFLLFLRETIGNGQFDWTVLKKVSKYGEELTLLCVVGGCCSKQAGWVKWSPQFSTIFIDVKDLEVPQSSKYDGQVHRDGFTLVIRQFQKTDLDIPYACSYGYDVSTKKVLINESAFTGGNPVEIEQKNLSSLLEKAINAHEENKEELCAWGEGISRATKIFLIIILPTLFGCLVVGIIIMVLVKVFKSKKHKDTKNILKGQNDEDIIDVPLVLKNKLDSKGQDGGETIDEHMVETNNSEKKVQNGKEKMVLLIHSEEFAVTTCCGRSIKTSIKEYGQKESTV